MTTLAAIGISLGGGAFVFAGCIGVFGLAVSRQMKEIAPRCTARPVETIYNPNAIKGGPQDRGNVAWGWMRWVMKLSYEQLLTGVDGTGTRNKGLGGDMIKVNLDQIVLLRFHSLCLRVSVVGTILCLLVILPIYTTTPYSSNTCEEVTTAVNVYDDNNRTIYTLTDYERTTLANIPLLTEECCGDDMSAFFGGYCTRLRWRLVGVVLCCWILYYQTCRLLQKEWKFLMSMKRVYYLEANHWENRKAELQHTLLGEQMYPEQEQIRHRDAWIPHPENRVASVNIDLYSVLVGNVPSVKNLMKIHSNDVDDNDGMPVKVNEIDWKLRATSQFFDYCIPNHQPGFSSSVAAISILPSASDLALAWKEWWLAAAAQRRLHYIRRLLADRLGDNHVSNTEHHVPFEIVEGHISIPRQISMPRNIYKCSIRNRRYYRDVLGFSDNDIESVLCDAVNFGPEQSAAYSIELAAAASGPCPYGWDEHRLNRASIDDLRSLEQKAIDNVVKTNDALREAQEKISCASSFFNNTGAADPAEQEQTMKTQNETNMKASTAVLEGEGSVDDEQVATTEDDIAELIGLSKPDSKAGGVFSGMWYISSTVNNTIKRLFDAGVAEDIKKGKKDLLDGLTYAVVTFTSRQAAVAARQCLMDGRGAKKWDPVDRLPVPPLADAPVGTSANCGRTCCRPVTMNIPRQQKRVRKYTVLAFLAAFYMFYLVPLTAVQTLMNPESYKNLSSEFKQFLNDHEILSLLITGYLPGLVLTAFFCMCPTLFQFVAYYGSNGTSKAEAEYYALQYYWWFMVLSAFWGASIGILLIVVWDEGGGFLHAAFESIKHIANAIPTTTSATWLSYTITRTFIILPFNYMLFFNSFLFLFLRIPSLSRANMGGGPGRHTPYRIYVDSGVVFMSLVALAPASPLVAPFTLLNFIYLQPLLRRNVIFAYRPLYDAGGMDWPFLCDLFISCLITGQVMMTTMLALKRAIGPAILAAVPVIPTWLFRLDIRKQYLRSYKDAALLQTSLLDEQHNTSTNSSAKKREEYRQFLVDAHRAAYIPACLAGSLTESLTKEPAFVTPLETDQEQEKPRMSRRSQWLSAATTTKKQGWPRLRRVSWETREISSNDGKLDKEESLSAIEENLDDSFHC